MNVIAGFATLRAGRSEIHEYEEMGGPHSTDIFLLGAVVYGDLDGVPGEEAVVVIDHQSYTAKGAGYGTSDVRVFTWKAGAQSQLARHDAVYGADVRIADGVITLMTSSGTMRCTEAFKLGNGTLTPLGKPVCAAI